MSQAPTARQSFFINMKSPVFATETGPKGLVGPEAAGDFFLLVILICLFFGCNPAWAEVDLDKIAIIESSGNPLAWNKVDDSRGLFQITPICLEEWNNFHQKQYTMIDLWNPLINREIADWYLNVRIPQMIKHYGKPDTTENRIIAFNAGIRYVKTGDPIPEITKQYIKKYFAK